MKETDSRTSAFYKDSYLQELPLKYFIFFFQIAWADFMYYDQLGKMHSLILIFLVNFQVNQSTQELKITMS